MKSTRSQYVVAVHTTRAESKAYGGYPEPYRLLFDPADGELLKAGERSKRKPTQALIDIARDFAMHELSLTK